MREYVVMKRPRGDKIEDGVDAENYLARTVHEEFELIDTGVLDDSGDKIMARRKIDPVGYIRFKGEKEWSTR